MRFLLLLTVALLLTCIMETDAEAKPEDLAERFRERSDCSGMSDGTSCGDTGVCQNGLCMGAGS
uniref:Conotoxin Cl14.11 n=1 Tax=Californiconus californicus TaxID=1736779 RepID=CUEB_CONCL